MMVIHGIFSELNIKDVKTVDGFQTFMADLRDSVGKQAKGLGDYFIKCVAELLLLSVNHCQHRIYFVSGRNLSQFSFVFVCQGLDCLVPLAGIPDFVAGHSWPWDCDAYKFAMELLLPSLPFDEEHCLPFLHYTYRGQCHFISFFGSSFCLAWLCHKKDIFFIPCPLVPRELTSKQPNWSFSDVSAQLCWNHRRETGSLDDGRGLQPWFLANMSWMTLLSLAPVYHSDLNRVTLKRSTASSEKKKKNKKKKQRLGPSQNHQNE